MMKSFRSHDLKSWHFEEEKAFIEVGEFSLELLADKSMIQALKFSLNHFLLKSYLEAGLAQDKELFTCPSCSLLHLEEVLQQEAFYCPHCHAIYRENELLTEKDAYHFNYSDSGFFEMTAADWGSISNHLGASFYSFSSIVRPIKDKILSYTVWFSFCLALIAASWYPYQWGFFSLSKTSFSFFTSWILCLMGLAFLSLSAVFYQLTGLLMHRQILPLLKPPAWQSLLEEMKRSKDLESIEKSLEEKGLGDHPGFLLNLALAYERRGDHRALFFLKKAQKICPAHPLFYSFLEILDSEQALLWKERGEKVRKFLSLRLSEDLSSVKS